ncbi:MAG: TorD/DmsD family molecular chaperone [Terriglobales bacterium]
MQAIAEQLTQLEAKATLHSLLARALNYPDQQLADSLASGEFSAALADLLTTLGHDHAAAEVRRLVKDPQVKAAKTLRLNLEKDYTWMFFASKPRIAYLFESVYREGKLLQESTFEIARLYRDAGLVLNEDFRLPPDHIAVELEFLSFLYFKEHEAQKANKPKNVDYARELQAAVLDRHLRHFAQSVAQRVGENARTSFYRTVARILGSLYSQEKPA